MAQPKRSALLPGCPAIDAGNNLSDPPATSDQRGVPFARTFDDPSVTNATGSDGTDIGAYERQTLSPLLFEVTTLSDELNYSNPDVSLREAIDSANDSVGEDTITFAASLTAGGPATMMLTLGQLQLTDAVTITGPGVSLLTIDAQGNSRIFHLDDGDGATEIEVEISGLTLTGGHATDGNNSSASEADYGGAILSRENLTLTGSTISGNSALFGGGLFNGGGTLTLTDSTISGNSTLFDGGGLWNYNGTLTVTNSTISGNDANRDGGGLFNRDGGTVEVSDSTISGNTASDGGGGLENIGGGTLTVTNSTISGNSAGDGGGGIETVGGGTLTVANSTISGNSAGAVDFRATAAASSMAMEPRRSRAARSRATPRVALWATAAASSTASAAC